VGNPKVEALRQVPLFNSSGHKELEFLATHTKEIDVEAGRTLIRQGSPNDTFYVLLEGEADVEVDGQARPPLGPGTFFGEISMLDRGPATATIVTTTPARLMVMSHAQLREAIKQNDHLLSEVIRAAVSRLRLDYTERFMTLRREL
jgi:CRP-like cAMP-binding protein